MMDDEPCLDGNVTKLAALKDKSEKLPHELKDQDSSLEQVPRFINNSEYV